MKLVERLTPTYNYRNKEVEVIELKSLGLSNREVAGKLKIHVNIVDQCLANAAVLIGDTVPNSLLATLIKTDVIDKDRWEVISLLQIMTN